LIVANSFWNCSIFGFSFQKKHSKELEDVRKAGHQAVSVIIEEYKVTYYVKGHYNVLFSVFILYD